MNLLKFLVHSNIYLAICAASIAFVCEVLYQMPFKWEPLFISFSTTLFLYNLNRYTDIEEDRINYPERIEFLERYGKKILGFSIGLYITSLIVAIFNFIAFLISILIFIIVIIYGLFKFKRIFLFKNFIVGISWGMIAFLVVVYNYEIHIFSVLIVFLIIFMRSLIQAIIFDVKDILGDKIVGINTLPSRYGVNKTKTILLFLNTLWVFFFLIIMFLGLLPSIAYFLIGIIFYSYFYIIMIGRINIKILCEMADGEDIIAGILMMIGYFLR